MLESDPLIIHAYLRVAPRSTTEIKYFFNELRPEIGITNDAIYQAIRRLRLAGIPIQHFLGRYHLDDRHELHHPMRGAVQVRGRGAKAKLCLRQRRRPGIPPR